MPISLPPDPADLPGTDELDPCHVCGSPVFMKTGTSPARGGVRRTMQVRSCTSPTCPTNVGPRRVGDAP